uniref:UBC core domain-containing protein n=1 Tax=Poecilia reticulata TaxID=8081 RepID=A0A3P9PW68_POERE
MAQHDPSHVASSQKALMLEMKSLQEEPVEGFKITLVDEADLYNWEVAIFGPPNTHYEGGYFKARIKFPTDYPYSPPAFRFLTKMWHPNIYEVKYHSQNSLLFCLYVTCFKTPPQYSEIRRLLLF